MNTTIVTVKINSYQIRNTVLFDGAVLQGANKTENCKSRPILACIDDLLKAIHDEVNGTYRLQVCGNAFEQALVRLAAAEQTAVTECSGEANSIPWPTQARLQYLQDAVGGFVDAQILAFSMVGNAGISLPDYPLISFSAAPNAPKLIISNDIYEIEDYWEEGNCEPVAFWIGGESRHLKNTGQYIIGCTEANVQDLVCAYLESRYINPWVGKLFGAYQNQFDVSRDPAAFLLDRIEPYFYMDAASARVQLFQGEACSLGIHSLSMDGSGRIRQDAAEDLSRLTWLKIEEAEDGSAGGEILTAAPEDLRQIRANGTGTSRIRFYFEDTIPLFSTLITVVPHVYIRSIQSQLLCEGQPVSRWKIGRHYDIATAFEPANAEDTDQITYTSSRPDIAQVVGNQVVILAEGEFTLTTAAKQAAHEVSYSIAGAAVKRIGVKYWLSKNQLVAGHPFRTDICIEPETANWSGFSYEIIKGRRCAELQIDKQGRVCIEAKKAGDCLIKFFSLDDPRVHCIQRLVVTPAPKIERVVANFGVVLLIIGLIALFLSFKVSIAPFIGALLLFAIGCLRREKGAKGMLISCLILLSLLLGGFGYLRVTEPESKFPQAELGAMIDESETTVLGSEYTERDLLSNPIRWACTDAEYLGYVFCETSDGAECGLYLIFDAKMANPDADAPKHLCAMVRYEGKSFLQSNHVTYSQNESIYYCESISDIRSAVRRRGDVVDTNIDFSALYERFDWQRYINLPEEVDPASLASLVDMCIEEAELQESGITLEAAYLSASKDLLSAEQSKLYIYLRKDVPNSENGMVTSYYYPFEFENLSLVTDSSGQLVLDLDAIEITVYEYVMRLSDSDFYDPDNWSVIGQTLP